MNRWVIKDWAGFYPFNKYIKSGSADQDFASFDDAEEFLSNWFEKQNLDYETNRGEYYICIKLI